jgi:RHS repeat-associated protein
MEGKARVASSRSARSGAAENLDRKEIKRRSRSPAPSEIEPDYMLATYIVPRKAPLGIRTVRLPVMRTFNMVTNHSEMANAVSSTAPAAVYVWAGGEIVANVTMGHYYFHDGRGNISHLTNGSNVLTERYTYDLNGTVSYFDANGPISSSVTGNRFLFAGAILLPESNLYDMRNRMYFPRWGRFLQTDPLGLQTEGVKLSAAQKARFSPGGVAPEAFSDSEWNLYRYCGNDPVDNSDPFGLEVQASLEYYIMPGTLGRGHMNLVLHDTTTGETIIGRGAPNQPYDQSALRSLYDKPQPHKSGIGNVKLKMDVNPGTKGTDPDTGNKTTTVPGSLKTLTGDMQTASAKLNQVAKQITDKNRDYRLQSVNSNSASATAYNQVTGQPPPPDSQGLLPGSNLNVLTGGRFPAPPAPRELAK